MGKACLIASCDVEPDVGLEHCWRHRAHQISQRPPPPAAVAKPKTQPVAIPSTPALKIQAADPKPPAEGNVKRCQAAGGCEKTFTAVGQGSSRRYCDEHRWVKGMARASGASPTKPPTERSISMTAKVRPIAPAAPAAGGGTASERKAYTRKPKDVAVTQLTDLVSSARAILGAAPNMKRVKLSLTLDRDGAIAVDTIAFTGVSGNS